jgi:hypothetical protein
MGVRQRGTFGANILGRAEQDCRECRRECGTGFDWIPCRCKQRIVITELRNISDGKPFLEIP